MAEGGLEPLEAVFPVVFFDGVKTTDMGSVVVDTSLNFKAFQSIMSKKIGVSPHQITIYFGRSPASLLFPAAKTGGRRTPVTNKFNFSSIIRERNCLFFVVSKRSRRTRRRRNRQTAVEDASGGRSLVNYPIHGLDYNSPDNFVLLRRNPNFHYYPASANPYMDQFALPNLQAGDNWYGRVDHIDHHDQARMYVEREKEKYLMSLNLNSNVYSDVDLLSRIRGLSLGISGSERTSDDAASSSEGVSSTGASTDKAVVCDVCANAEAGGETAPFHSCKYDAILTTVFRSPAGPIARPVKEKAVQPESE